MKFPIRIKFFVVLLAFSLGPMLISRTLMGREARNMASVISDQTYAEMLAIIRADLENNAIAFLNYLDVRGKGMSLAVQMVAHRAEQLLFSKEDPPHSELYFASNFSPGGKAPEDTAESDAYVRVIRGGGSLPMPVSLNHAAFRFPLRGSGGDYLDEAHRLNGAVPLIRETLEEQDLHSPWLNIGLESGVFLTYPGHGFFPMRYEHRNQRWYLDARHARNGNAVWTTPGIDPASRLAISTVSYPIFDPSGGFAGAVSLNMPISRIIREVSLKSRWSEQIESFLVQYIPENGDHQARLLILAQDSYDQGRRRNWMRDIEAETMTSDDRDGFANFLKRLSTESSGLVKLPYKGRDCFWAFASNGRFSFLLVAPDTVVSKLPNQMASSVDSLFQDIRDISAVVSGFMFILVGFIAWFGSKAVTKPMLIMSEAARRLAGGDTSVRLNMYTGDERDILINAFNDMVPKLREHIAMSRDYELAYEVQHLLLPRVEPRLSGYDLSGGITFCDQTGGDYYDFIEVASEEGQALGVALGDVSGHGMPSALLMATARGQLHSLSLAPLSPAERIQAINTVLSRDMDGSGRFLTLFYLRLNANDATVRWVRAGHDPAFRYNPARDEFSELGGEGLALGVIEEYDFKEYETVLEPGEILVLATDGVWEARDAAGEMFGKERILAIIRENAHKDADGIREAIMDGVEAYQANGQEDDIAVVVIRKVKDVSRHTISFRMTNKENCFKRFQPEVEEFGRQLGLSRKVIFHLTLVLDELINNIISYGYADFDEHPIDVTLDHEGDILTIRLEDDAQPFNILESPPPELDVPLDERHRPVGGMGVHLVKSMVHLIKYERKDDKNILTLTKDLTKHCTGGHEPQGGTDGAQGNQG